MEMRAGLLRARTVVVPSVGAAKIGIEIVFVDAAVESVCAALRHDLDLAARTAGEVRSLVCRGDLKLLHAGHRDGNNRRRCLGKPGTVHGAGATGGVRSKALDIRVVVAAHVIGCIAAVKLEGVLVARIPSDVAIDVLTRLKNGQGRGVTALVRQVDKRLSAEGRADGSVHGLQLGTGGIGHLDCTGNASDFKSRIYGQLKADFYPLARNYGLSETVFGD